jgi:hypothetical protein
MEESGLASVAEGPVPLVIADGDAGGGVNVMVGIVSEYKDVLVGMLVFRDYSIAGRPDQREYTELDLVRCLSRQTRRSTPIMCTMIRKHASMDVRSMTCAGSPFATRAAKSLDTLKTADPLGRTN